MRALLLALALLAGACGSTPPTDKPLDARAALELLGARAEVFGLDADPACFDRVLGPRFHDEFGTCATGLTIDAQIWLVIVPGRPYSEGSLPHEVLHLRGLDHPPAGWPADSPEGREIAANRALLAAHPEADRP